ncbi:MAG: hypothetical protein ACE5I7_13510, partial [Candidatus Binatia bacterium]
MAKRDKQCTGRSYPFRDLAEKLDRDGGDPLPLQLRRHQTHGLVAHGSDRHEQCDIDIVGNEP